MAAARQVANEGQASAQRVDQRHPSRGSGAPMSWRLLYSAHPRLMPTVYVPGPVVTARKV